MVLYTKSIRLKSSKKDGLRICIMRNPDEEFKYHKWMPQLSPSSKLRTEVKKGIGWDKFKEKFLKELKSNKNYLSKLVDIAQDQDVTILCVESDPSYCHRSIVAQEASRLNKKLKVVIE